MLREDRPALLMSSTSWTVDEDFGVLRDALHKYDKAKTKGEAKLPSLVCIITGKGPEKAAYMQRMEEMRMRHVQASRDRSGDGKKECRWCARGCRRRTTRAR